MVSTSPEQGSRDVSGVRLLLLYGLCFALVVFYVNMFQFWAWVSRELGPGNLRNALPVIVTVIVLAVISSRFISRVNRGYRISLLFLGLGIVGTFLALAIPDPRYPIKRIHVAEYIILSFLVRYTLSHRLQGAALTLFTILATLLLGVHDEMLQGLHAMRYYGWRDIIVNGTAGMSGALLGHGLFCCERSVGSATGDAPGWKVLLPLFGLFGLLLGAVGWQAASLFAQRGEHISSLSLLPLAGVSLVILVFYPEVALNSRKQHGLQVILWLAVTLLVYPLLANFVGMEFI